MSDQDKLDQFVATKAQGGLTKDERADIAKEAHKLKDVNTNLAFARLAVRSVLGGAKMGAANWDERQDFSAEAIFEKARPGLRSDADFRRAQGQSEAAWDRTDKCVYGKLRQDSRWHGGVGSRTDILNLANLVDDYSCGNCMELTAKAFMVLFTMGIRPLDYMALTDPADHAFVVIGRIDNPNDDAVGKNWTKGAVVCDPWAYGYQKALPRDPRTGVQSQGPADAFGFPNAAYPVTLLQQNMSRMHSKFNGLTVEYHEP